uniref:Uncharacterized protein n=1 Tax=Salvator merianae TaxID=96440 RepID=A0A8D0BRV3_SALMN
MSGWNALGLGRSRIHGARRGLRAPFSFSICARPPRLGAVSFSGRQDPRGLPRGPPFQPGSDLRRRLLGEGSFFENTTSGARKLTDDANKQKIKGMDTLIGAAIGFGISAVALPAVLGAAGFTAAGIAAGSLGAKMMSAAAIANGGGVAAGSLVATLQSVGAAGVPVAVQAATTTVGAAVGAVAKLLQ